MQILTHLKGCQPLALIRTQMFAEHDADFTCFTSTKVQILTHLKGCQPLALIRTQMFAEHDADGEFLRQV